MEKKCVICGALFKASPSDKKVTCSPGCRSKRAALAARNSERKWSEEKKKKRAEDQAIIEHMADMQSLGVQAAMGMPESQRGPQNRASMVWELITPEGRHIVVKNLLDWSRENCTLFEPPCDGVDAAAKRIANGFMAIASSMRGVRSRNRPVSSYKGWGLYRLPTKEGTND